MTEKKNSQNLVEEVQINKEVKSMEKTGKVKGEMTLEKKIKNLQVSISIAKKDIKDIMQSLPNLKPEEKATKLNRLAQLEKIIDTKTRELEPLKAQRTTNPGSRSKIIVTPEEVEATAKKYNISL
jgi:hypothetical protein